MLLHTLKGFLFTPGSNRVVYVLESVWKDFALDWELFSLLKWNCSSACIEERSTPISLMHKRQTPSFEDTDMWQILWNHFSHSWSQDGIFCDRFSVGEEEDEYRILPAAALFQAPLHRNCPLQHNNQPGVLIISLLYLHNRNCHWKYVDILLLLFLVEI